MPWFSNKDLLFKRTKHSSSLLHAHTFLELNKITVKVTKLWDFCGVLKGVCFVFFGFFVQLFWPFYGRVRLFSTSVHAFMLSWSLWTATKSFFSDTMLFFARSIGTLIKHGKHRQTPRETSADHGMIAIVDDEELEKRARHLEYRKYTTKRIVDSPCQPCLVWMDGGRQRFDDPNHWRQWDNSPSQSWDFEYHWQGWT